MKRFSIIILSVFLAVALVVPAAYGSDDLAKKLNDILAKAPAEGHWQIKAADLNKMITEKKTDFVVVDVRPTPPGQQGGKIAGAMYIPYNEVLKAENLKKLPKDKKLILVCVTGQTQNLPIVPLRALGYNAYTLSFGMSSWAKGYLGAGVMQGAIAGANFPVEK